MLSNIEGIEPLSIFFLILVQFGGRYLKIELTPAQQKIINNSIFQTIILFSIVYMATKSFAKSVIIVLLIYISINVLFNENHKYNVLSRKWLIKEKILKENKKISLKEIYKKNIEHIISFLYWLIILLNASTLLLFISITFFIVIFFLFNSLDKLALSFFKFSIKFL